MFTHTLKGTKIKTHYALLQASEHMCKESWPVKHIVVSTLNRTVGPAIYHLGWTLHIQTARHSEGFASDYHSPATTDMDFQHSESTHSFFPLKFTPQNEGYECLSYVNNI